METLFNILIVLLFVAYAVITIGIIIWCIIIINKELRNKVKEKQDNVDVDYIFNAIESQKNNFKYLATDIFISTNLLDIVYRGSADITFYDKNNTEQFSMPKSGYRFCKLLDLVVHEIKDKDNILMVGDCRDLKEEIK